jgi:hypothetical protein
MNKNYGILLFVLLICFASHSELCSMIPPMQRVTASRLSKVLEQSWPVKTRQYQAQGLWQRIYGRLFGQQLEVKQFAPNKIVNLEQQRKAVETLMANNRESFKGYYNLFWDSRSSKQWTYLRRVPLWFKPDAYLKHWALQREAEHGMKRARQNNLELDKVRQKILTELHDTKKMLK